MTSPHHAASLLKHILETQRLNPVREAQRLRGLFTDQAAHLPAREREALLRAIPSPIFERAWQAQTRGTPGTLNGLAQWLADEHGYAAELCHWASETWALALGLVPTSTASGTHNRRTTVEEQADSKAAYGRQDNHFATSLGQDNSPIGKRPSQNAFTPISAENTIKTVVFSTGLVLIVSFGLLFLGVEVGKNSDAFLRLIWFFSLSLSLSILCRKHSGYFAPNLITLPGTVIGILFSFASPSGGTIGGISSILGAAVLFGILWCIAWGSLRFFDKESVGGGAIKTGAMVGAFCGLPGAVYAGILAIILGTVIGWAGILVGSISKQDNISAVDPLLIAGAIVLVYLHT